MKKIRIICLPIALILILAACGNAVAGELRQEISALEQEVEKLQKVHESTNEAFAKQSAALMLHDDLLAAYEQLYSHGVKSIEALSPPDSAADLGYVLSTGDTYYMSPFHNAIDHTGVLYEVCGAFKITSLEGETGVFLYCFDTAPRTVPPLYCFLPIETAQPYSEDTKE